LHRRKLDGCKQSSILLIDTKEKTIINGKKNLIPSRQKYLVLLENECTATFFLFKLLLKQKHWLSQLLKTNTYSTERVSK
jgi:hypothetical protein